MIEELMGCSQTNEEEVWEDILQDQKPRWRPKNETKWMVWIYAYIYDTYIVYVLYIIYTYI